MPKHEEMKMPEPPKMEDIPPIRAKKKEEKPIKEIPLPEDSHMPKIPDIGDLEKELPPVPDLEELEKELPPLREAGKEELPTLDMPGIDEEEKEPEEIPAGPIEEPM
ncbi:MAG: hypothetical protein IIB66_06990, partial [Proteobacteria bacterium]|nr:hypothetical protein [Pseudomonadota bacterium]